MYKDGETLDLTGANLAFIVDSRITTGQRNIDGSTDVTIGFDLGSAYKLRILQVDSKHSNLKIRFRIRSRAFFFPISCGRIFFNSRLHQGSNRIELFRLLRDTRTQ